MRHISVTGKCGAGMIIALAAGFAVDARADQAAQVYQQLQNLESAFPAPISPPNIAVGSFDLSTDSFSGPGHVVTDGDMATYADRLQEFRSHDKSADGKPAMTHEPAKPVASPFVAYILDDDHASITITVAHRTGSVSVTANGHTVTSAADAITVPIGAATEVDWSLKAGARTCAGHVSVRRVPKVGLGVAQIPVVPLAVVYDVPQDQQHRNAVTFAQTSSAGSTVALSFSNTSSTTSPGDTPGGYGTMLTVKSVLSAVGQAASNVPSSAGPAAAVAGAAGSALSFIASSLGSASATNTDSSTNATQTTKGVTYSLGSSYTLDTHLGPGEGDKIVFIRGPRLIMVSRNGVPYTAKLFDGGMEAVTVHLLKQKVASLQPGQIDPGTQLDKDTMQALLALDPQAASPAATLDPRRYADMGTYTINGGTDTYSYSCTITAANQGAQTTTKVHAESYTPGTFARLGIGVTEDKNTSVQVSNTSAFQSGGSQTISTAAQFSAGADEIYTVEGYYDSVFGTFLFRRVDMNAAPRIVGHATDSSGKPKGRALVTLEQDGKRFATRTDANGNYVIASPSLKATPAQATIEGVTQRLDLARLQRGAPLKADIKGK